MLPALAGGAMPHAAPARKAPSTDGLSPAESPGRPGASSARSSEPALARGLVVLLAILLGLRLFAAVETVTVRTWDDVQFRGEVEAAVAWVDAAGPMALPSVVLAPRSLLSSEGRRAGGYLAWLLVARELLPGLDPERAYQAANVVALLLQLVLVHALFRPASRTLALTAATLYLAVPFVFGLNRWVWTENHVMLALLAYTWAGAWLLGARREGRYREAAAGLAAGVVCALASMTREYAAPSVALLPAAIALALLLRRRHLAAATFSVPVAVYAVPFLQDTAYIWSTALEKAAHPNYHHSVAELLLHSARHVTGIPVTLLLAAGLSAAGTAAWRGRRTWRTQPLVPVLWAHLLLLAVYAGLIVWSTNRISRGMVPIVWTAIGATAMAVRISGLPGERRRRQMLTGLAAAVVASLAFLGYDLFVAFDGGRTYAAHAYQLGTFNHPLFLRELRDASDMHVVIP